MKVFIAKGFHLAALPVPAKLVYSFFLIFIGIGLWTSWAMYRDRMGSDLRGPNGQPSVEERYVDRAPAADHSPTTQTSGAGPALELASEPPAKPVEDHKKPWIMDVFHQHVFSVSVVFLILAHLFILTRLHPAVAGTVIAVAGSSALLHVLAPVIIWQTKSWLWLMPVTGAAMGLSWTLMVGWSLVAMWLGGGKLADKPLAA
ncbi:MAG: hypothetical protein EXR77_05370 [Myxococcales bacterium]|nr:hypothetical protein [Myxococcales bacterium]